MISSHYPNSFPRRFYLINSQNGRAHDFIYSNFLIGTKNGTIIGGGQDIKLAQPVSHYRNTELFITLTVTQTNPFPAGDYVIKYTVKDQIKGKSFDISKDITIT
jgi:hypothetical protein